MAQFFILSLERSRSAWISAALSGGSALCLHEAAASHPSPWHMYRSLRELSNTLGIPVGTADTGLALFASRVPELVNRDPIVIVERPAMEVMESLKRLGLYDRQRFSRHWEALGLLKKRLPNALLIPYNSLDEPATGRRIHEHIGLTNFNEQRWRMLAGLKIEADLKKLAERTHPGAIAAVMAT